ncbi:MAG: methionine aminotransferase [Cytophagaceae bacterium]|nr:methionine aminotransferase [Cytophagaceae bacterium]
MESKLPHVDTTIFTVMSRLANEHKAINLAQGFPDFCCSEELVSLVNHYMQCGHNQYAPMPGIMPLRERIAEKVYELYKASYSPETEITVTCGATEACYAAITALVRPGDEVIIFEPAFDCYAPVIELNGGKPVYIELKYPEFKIDWEEVQKKITASTKLIIINSPHNPTGSVLDFSDIKKLNAIVKDTDILIMSDEVYEHIIFDNIPHASILNFPELRERSLVIFSFGKTFHTTGWRMGYCLAPAKLSREFQKIHQYITFSTPTPMQYAVADFLKQKHHYQDLPQFYQQKRDKFISLLKNSRFELIPSAGTYFQLVSYKNITDEHDTDLAIRLTREKKIASIPVSVFYKNKRDDKLLRFCFAKEDQTLEKAAEILCRI